MDIRRIKLYHFPMSRSARVKWLLHELVGDDFDVERIALYQGEQYSAENLARNPNHAVPVLDLTLANGEVFTMIESGAMISLLADTYAQKQLAPPPLPFSTTRADYLQMLHFGSSWMDMMLWQLRLHRDIFPDDQRDQRTIDRYMDKFAQEVEPALKARLEQTPFICGENFLAVDCLIGHNLGWARMYQLAQDDTFSRYLDSLSERPAYQAAFADRDQFMQSP